MNSADVSLEYVACNLCGGNNTRKICTKNGRFSGLPFDLVKCRDCGLFYLNPRLSEETLLRFYNTDYYSGRSDESNYFLEFERQSNTYEIDFQVSVLKKLVPAPAKILDVGCGLGTLLRALEREGYEVEGIEISPVAADFAKKNGLHVVCGDFCETERARNEYDAIVAIEVVEHVYNPMEFFRRAYDSLKPGGIFYCTTGNFQNFTWQHALFGRASVDCYIVPEEHVVLYSTDTMKRYYQKAGFSRALQLTDYSLYHERQALTRFFMKCGLLQTDSLKNAPGYISALYWFLIRNIDRFFKPPLPLAQK